ncbi:unnamed protein product [Closterium sp. NIES-54]
MKNAFLQSKLDRVLYMHQPDYFDDGTGRVCKLLKSLYGLKQSPLLWYRALDGVLLGAGWKKSQVNQALYFKAGDDGVTCWVLVYVDDLLAASSSPAMLKELKELLEAAFELREISPVVKYLGLEIVRDRPARKLWLHQQGYADKLRRRFIDEEQGGRLPKTPVSVDAYAELTFDDDEAQRREEEDYRQKVGSLQFAAMTTRPDIAFACSKLGSGLTVRSDQHWREVDRCLAYLADTRDTALEFGGGPESLELIGYVDADNAGDKQDQLLRSGVAIFDLDYDAILAAMYALSVSAEGDCYLCVPPDPGIEAAALGVSESALPGTAPAEALHTFTLDSDWLTPQGGPVLARSSTVLLCPALPSGSLSGLHLPSFSTNLMNTDALRDAMVTTTTPGGQRVSICTCTRTGRHLATFTRRPGSSLYTLVTETLQVAASAQVSASGLVAPLCSCCLLSHQTLLWHHRLGHPSLPRLRGMHSRLFVSGLPGSLATLLPSLAPPCLPCVEGRQQRAAPHSSSFPPTTAPLQTLQMDVWGPARVIRFQLRERFRQDLPILRLHSDRGGEFSSDLLRDFSRGEGILKSFTLPTSLQQNGIAERRIGLVMEVTRTFMIHADAPHFLWPVAVRYAAPQLNLWPRVSLPETSPTLRWTEKVGDASLFQVWGSRAFVCDTSADKLSARTIPCVAASSQVFAAASRSSPTSAPWSCRPLSHETLLWHHRLGYPSLPRLRGMASRSRGRQRAAPHSSTFPPTEAPLQNLHMDVWGPARVRGQGHERYFLLVVDDYSRYTTVFPLRSKGEVTEGIHQTFMLPASPQQNGIAERRIGMVMDVARTSMIHAAAPHFLWPFAVQYTAHQINLQPRVSLPETTPTLQRTGKVGDASVFRVWGS